MNRIGEYWNTLGQRLEAATAGMDTIEDFSGIATEALTALPAPRMTAAEIAEWVIEEGKVPPQVNYYSSFGDPPLVVYSTPKFYIEALFWFPSSTAIHGHAFTGAFVVLDGFSIETRYLFHSEREIEDGVLQGRLVPREVEFIGPGKVCSILGADSYVHAVAHMGNPSITLVVRTYGSRVHRQYRYHRCGLATCSNLNKNEIPRQAAVLLAVRRAAPADFLPTLERFLRHANVHTFYGVLEVLMRSLPAPMYRDELLPFVEARFGETRGEVLAGIREILRGKALWAGARNMPGAHGELQVALAEFLPDPVERDAVLRSSYGENYHQLPAKWREMVVASVKGTA
ncbi:MAG: hypothetical protein HZA32_16660 [Opitutae bacterium]|nr:hypothetical protein [Opitutae bacterium]